MNSRSLLASALALVLCTLGCSGAAERSDPTDAGPADQDASLAPSACTIRSDCVDIDVEPLATPACCTPVSSCGWVVPEVDEELLVFYPEAKAVRAELVKDDPNGQCAPESFLFGSQAGLPEERVAVEGGDEILIAESCQAFHIEAFTLGGCCLPDDSCGLSTHSTWPTLESIANDSSAPFAQPECVRAEVLNQQFRDSTLGSLAHATGGGTCDYAELDARLPR